MKDSDSVPGMWAAFVATRPEVSAPDAPCPAWHFCDNQVDADALAELVCAGRKRATAGALWAYEADDDPLPRVGDLSIVTDWAGTARCVIRTTSVEVIPYDEVTVEFAATEGEGDGSLEYWRRVHEEFFTKDLGQFGLEFRVDMPVVCERFEVVFGGLEGSS